MCRRHGTRALLIWPNTAYPAAAQNEPKNLSVGAGDYAIGGCMDGGLLGPCDLGAGGQRVGYAR